MERKKRDKIIEITGEEEFFKVWPETNSWIVYIPNFLELKDGQNLFDTLMTDVKWQWEQSFFGNPPCRKIKWYGDFEYTFSKKLP